MRRYGAGFFGAAHAPAYAASKGGIVALTKSLAVAWAKDNIRVAEVARIATTGDLLFGQYILLRKGKRTYAVVNVI